MPYRRFVSAVAIVILPIVLIACGERPQADPRTAAPLVRVTTIQDAVAKSYTFTGTVAARVQSDLAFVFPAKY